MATCQGQAGLRVRDAAGLSCQARKIEADQVYLHVRSVLGKWKDNTSDFFHSVVVAVIAVLRRKEGFHWAQYSVIISRIAKFQPQKPASQKAIEAMTLNSDPGL